MTWTRLAGDYMILNTARIMHAFYGAKYGLYYRTTKGPFILLEIFIKF